MRDVYWKRRIDLKGLFMWGVFKLQGRFSIWVKICQRTYGSGTLQPGFANVPEFSFYSLNIDLTLCSFKQILNSSYLFVHLKQPCVFCDFFLFSSSFDSLIPYHLGLPLSASCPAFREPKCPHSNSCSCFHFSCIQSRRVIYLCRYRANKMFKVIVVYAVIV